MKLTYKVAITDNGKPMIHLSCGGEHLGTIWGEIEDSRKSDFDKSHDIVDISGHGGERIATFWGLRKREL